MTDKITPILEKIRQQRLTHNVRQKELASYLDLDVRTYNNIENGKSNLSLQQLFAIADYFKKDIAYFTSSAQNNYIENSSYSGIFYDSSSQNNYSKEAIEAYKLLTEKMIQEINGLKEKVRDK